MLTIDYSTLNLVLPLTYGNEDITVYCPPALKEDVNKVVLVLSKLAYAPAKYNISSSLIIVDWETYVIDVIDELAIIKFGSEDSSQAETYKQMMYKRIYAMLERILTASYIIKDYVPVMFRDTEYFLDEKLKSKIMGNIIFFILLGRYYSELTTSPQEENTLKDVFTSLSAMEYATSLKTRKSKDETLEKE